MTDLAGLDLDGFATWLERTHPELVQGPLTARLLTGGRSNLTYRLDGGLFPLVVRRPPLGHVLSTAHDMAREYRVMSALAESAVPVPETIDIVDDTEAAFVTGTPFLVMKLVEGRVLYSRRDNAPFTRAGVHRVGIELVEALAALHSLDPESVGLDTFGRPDGYLDRQLATWRRQLDASRTRELSPLDRLQDQLATRSPSSGSIPSAIVHGDYRLDNALVTGEGDAPRIAAILDWEMSTLGDPLVDLGMLGLYWNISDLEGAAAVMPSAVDVAAGSPPFDELVEVYASEARIELPNLGWYRAFAAYKLAVIAEGIHARWRAGKTVGAGFELVGTLVEPLADEGIARLSSGR